MILTTVYAVISVIALVAYFEIHVAAVSNYYKNSLIINLLCHLASFITGIWVILWFVALSNCCWLIWNYYNLVDESMPSLGKCIENHVYYLLWLIMVIILTIIWIYSIWNMWRAYKYLWKREEEKLKKLIWKKELKARLKKQKAR